MGTVLVNQGGNPWTFAAIGGSGVLPITIARYDFIPNIIRFEPDATSVAGLCAVIQDVQGREVYREVLAGAYFEAVEQSPRGKQKWIGYYNPAVVPGPPANTANSTDPGISLTVLTSGILYLYF
jgi:hypothetical protein